MRFSSAVMTERLSAARSLRVEVPPVTIPAASRAAMPEETE